MVVLGGKLNVRQLHAILILCVILQSQSRLVHSRFSIEVAGDQVASIGDDRKTEIKKLFNSLKPNGKRSALVLGFDTDESSDSESYAQFYNDFQKLPEKKPTNQTLLLVRDGAKLELASKLGYIASPQSGGWLLLGQTRYFEPKPRDKNEHLDGLEAEGSLKNFAFDYSRVWSTAEPQKIDYVRNQLRKKTKSEIDREYRRLPKDEREFHRNISDYEKIGWVSDGYYVADGYWSLIHGGAAWFEAREESRLVNLGKQKLSGELDKWFSKKKILDQYQSTFDTTRRNESEAKSNDMDAIWQRWSVLIGGEDSERIPTFTLERQSAQTRMIGRVLVDGNIHRSFLLEEDFGRAPRALARYDNPEIDFNKAKALFVGLIDIFISPNHETVVLLTEKELIGIDVETGSEIYREEHELKFNKVVMVEWAIGQHVAKWKQFLSSL